MICEIGYETQRVIQIEVDRKSLAVIIVGKCEAAPHGGLAPIGGPCNRNSRLEVVLVPVIKWFTAIGWTGSVNHDRVDEVGTLFASGDALGKILSQGNRGLDFKPMSLINRTLETVAQSQCESQVGTDLPTVLYVFVIGLGGEIPGRRSATGQQGAIFGKSKVSCHLCETADDRRPCVPDFPAGCEWPGTAGVVRVRPSARQIIRIQEGLKRIRNACSGTRRIKRGIHFCEIKGILKADPTIANESDVGSKLHCMFPVDPGNIIREIMHRCYPRERVSFSVVLIHEAEGSVVPSAVAACCEGLPG